MNYTYLKMSFSSAGLLAFLCIYTIDSLVYPLSSRMGIDLPIGFLGILMGFVLFGVFIASQASFAGWLFRYVYVLIIIILLGLVSFSPFVNIGDYYVWLRTLAFFSAGYFFAIWLHQNEENEFLGKSFFLISLVLCFSSFSLRSLDNFNYLRVSDGVALTSILAVVFNRGANIKVIMLACLGLLSLYLIGSRAGLVLFLASLLVIYFKSISKVYFIVIVSSIAVVSLYYASVVYVGIDNIHDNRFLRIIFEREADTSLASRMYMHDWAIDILRSNPLLGEYAYYRGKGLEGAYAHNFISFVAELGLVGASMLVLLLCPQLLLIKRFLSSSSPDKFFMVGAAFCVTSVIGVLVAKSYIWSVFYFSAGVSVSILINGFISKGSPK